MNANELADVLKSDIFKIGHSITSYHIAKLKEAATMLRQQQAEIEALKQAKAHEYMNYLLEIEVLKAELDEENQRYWNNK